VARYQGHCRGSPANDDDQDWNRDDGADHEDLPQHEAGTDLLDSSITQRESDVGDQDDSNAEGDFVGSDAAMRRRAQRRLAARSIVTRLHLSRSCECRADFQSRG
jgi:hypothetical protein